MDVFIFCFFFVMTKDLLFCYFYSCESLLLSCIMICDLYNFILNYLHYLEYISCTSLLCLFQ